MTPQRRPLQFVMIDHPLFTAALTDATLRPRALVNLQTILSAVKDSHLLRASDWSQRLIVCAVIGWDDAVRALLAAGVDVHAMNDKALRGAAENGKLLVVECLLAADANVHALNDEALRCAVDNHHLPVVERLLAAGADVHAGNDAVLRMAAMDGHLPIVECLLSAGADVVRAFHRADNMERDLIAKTLDAAATTIPPAQRQKILSSVHQRMPALAALDRAEHRRASRPINGTGTARRAQKQPGGRAAR